MQPDLFPPPAWRDPAIPHVDEANANVIFLVPLLQDRDWSTAAELLPMLGRPVAARFPLASPKLLRHYWRRTQRTTMIWELHAP